MYPSGICLYVFSPVYNICEDIHVDTWIYNCFFFYCSEYHYMIIQCYLFTFIETFMFFWSFVILSVLQWTFPSIFLVCIWRSVSEVGVYPGVELLGLIVCEFSTFLNIAKLLFRVVATIYIIISVYEISHSHSVTVLFSYFADLFDMEWYFIMFLFAWFFLASLHGLWDLSSLTKDWTRSLSSGSSES